MKTLAFCILLMNVLAIQPIQTNLEVPESILINFNQKYPNAEDVDWDKNDEVYTASFVHSDSYFKEVDYNKDGTWISTKTDMDEYGIPDAAQSYISNKMEDADFEYDQVTMSERPNDNSYFVILSTEDGSISLIFDEDGNLIEEEE